MPGPNQSRFTHSFVPGTFVTCCASAMNRAEHDEDDTESKPNFLSLLRYHLITRSALASTLGGITRPICLAVFKLITSSKLVVCSTGISLGLVPFRTLSIRTAARRKVAGKLGPYDIRPPASTQSLFSNIAGN